MDVSTDLPNIEERRALIERVAASEPLSRSARLRDLLLYVGNKSLREDSAGIHEQEIGTNVFGRPSGYDCSSDGIVRVNATELRKRIASYFQSSGTDEAFIFEIPRGGYSPVFRRRLESPPTAAASLDQGASTPPVAATMASSSSFLRERLAWAAVSLALAAACAVLVQQNAGLNQTFRPWEGKPAVATFWTEFLRAPEQTDIVLPDDSASVIEDITGHPNDLSAYLSQDYHWIESSNLSADRKKDLHTLLGHNLVTFGAVHAAQLILNQIPPRDQRSLTLARYYTAAEIKRDNVVLVGGQKALPWDRVFDSQLNFVTDYDDTLGQAYVRNRNPKPGEQAIYKMPRSPNSLISYSSIAYLPNPSGNGSVIILAGTDSDATGAAAEFLTSEEQMERLRNTLRVNRFPYFEVLLKVSRLGATSFNAELVACRTYPQLH